MLVANDFNGNKIKPSEGRIGLCPMCNGKVIAICGNINIWHWRHENLKDCDSWSEGETKWHIDWKNEFPLEWQEIIIQNESFIHRADIKTPSNLVLELQNSSISTFDIQLREEFYDKMIWLINAEDFKNNIKKVSIVKKRLREHDKYNPKEYYFEEKNYLNTERKELIDISKDIEEKSNLIDEQTKNLDKINILFTKLNHFDYNLLKDYYTSNIMQEFQFDLKPIKNKLKQIENLESEISKKNQLLARINSLQNCEITNYEHYKICNPEQVNSSIYKKCALIEKNQFLFPEIILIESEYKFQVLTKNPNYYFTVDFSEHLIKIENEVTAIRDSIVTLKNEIKELLNELEKNIRIFLLKKKETSEKIHNDLEIQISKLSKQYKTKLEEYESLIKECEELFDQSNKNKVYEHEKERFEIMKKYKGQYTFFWKNKRKIWDFATKRKFLDFGDSIFELISDSTIKKFTKQEFIDLIKNHF
jgi:competence CoiA-like predicted nuclease